MQKNRIITLYENKTQLIISAIDKIVVEIFNKKENDKQAQSILLTGCSVSPRQRRLSAFVNSSTYNNVHS